MGLYSMLPENLHEVDVIIAGGGTAGCIIAARLADANPALSILVVEAGPNNVGEPTLTHPAFWISQILPTSKFTSFYKAIQSDFLAGREPIIPSGRALGGGSAINLLQYSRGQRSDYDGWNTTGWSADDILACMKKFETYHGPDPRDLHGHDGPIHVSEGTYRSERFSTDLINSLGKAGRPETADLNTMDTVNRSMRALRYVDHEGKRQDTATKYLHPRLEDGKHPNLHVIVESRIDQISFDDNKNAVGVVYRPSTTVYASSAPRTIKARRMVVLSCGALGSPLVLERAWIGNPEIVKRGGADLIADLPGVGENYDDHHMMIYAYKSSLHPDETLDGVITGRSKPQDMIMAKDKHLGWNTIDVQAKVRPSDAEVANLGPRFQAAWERKFKDKPDKPLMLMASTICFPGDPTGQPPGQYYGMVSLVCFFSDAEGIDIKKHLWMYKKQREIARRMDVFRGEVASWHPKFPAGSKAACIETDAALGDVPEIEYSAEDNAAILQWLREHVDTTWHSMGTCKMAPREENGVVDPSLGVHGVQRLKVADLSVPPSNVAANTNSTAMAIGEKAADIMIKELGLSVQ